MHPPNTQLSGYLDVKISEKSRRGFTPWKAWQKQWCELRRLDTIEYGVELKLKSSAEGAILNCINLPRNCTIFRTDSRTKQYAFGVFSTCRTAGGSVQKPLVFLAGVSETNSQQWMGMIRRMLCITTYLPVGDSNFYVSIVDNSHSRAAGIVGLHGVLCTNTQEIIVSDPWTGQPMVYWRWYHFHQFHFQASTQSVDDKRILVMHTSREFPAGPGQLYLYCEQGPQLLNHLVSRGKNIQCGMKSSKRLSRSEGDLCSNSCPKSPICMRSQTGSDDSGVRDSISSDDSDCLLKSKIAILSSMGALTKTPGGSESESLENLTAKEEPTRVIPRNESGISLASGIYEEIPESHLPKKVHHIYENPLDLAMDLKMGKYGLIPPPLPPRRLDFACKNIMVYKTRCNTLPAKDLSRMSQIFTSDPDYVVMSPSKNVATKEKVKITTIAESLYTPMAPVIKNTIENCYMIMNGKK